MNSYKKISLWENTRRIEVLQEFRNDVIGYFKNSRAHRIEAVRIEQAEAVQARQRINLTSAQAQHIIAAAGIPQIITWTPPPAFGGYEQKLHLILNLFEFDMYEIPPQNAVDIIERALGVYQSDRTAALVRTFNPFWWLFRGFLWFTRFPFVVLGAIGFDAGRAEGSVVGKIIKVLLLATSAVLTSLAAVLTSLYYLGWLPAAKALMGIE